jgi:hypothetical protein
VRELEDAGFNEVSAGRFGADTYSYTADCNEVRRRRF